MKTPRKWYIRDFTKYGEDGFDQLIRSAVDKITTFRFV